MLSERAFRWLALFGSTWSHFFILSFIRDAKTGGLKIGSSFLQTVFRIFSFPGQFQLAYSIVSILLEMPKSHRNPNSFFLHFILQRCFGRIVRFAKSFIRQISNA